MPGVNVIRGLDSIDQMSINDISSKQPSDVDLADAFRRAKQKVMSDPHSSWKLTMPSEGNRNDDNMPSVSRLVNDVAELSRKSEAAIGLLGEIVATFSLTKNRDLLSQHESGQLLLEIADGWVRRFEQIVGPVCTGVSANWCPIHGNCTCRDPDDKNDDDCPLHSASSTHAESR